MVLLRALAGKSPHVDVLERIKEICNKVLFSTPILREWICKAFAEGMTSVILLRKLEEIRKDNKMKKCGGTSIDKARKMINRQRCMKPTDRDDLKFVEVALATGAVLVTCDPHLLVLNPYVCGRRRLKIMTPEDYLVP